MRVSIAAPVARAPGALRVRRVLMAALLSAGPLAAGTPAVELPGAPGSLGVVAVVDTKGMVKRRFTGAGDPSHLSRDWSDGTYLLTDRWKRVLRFGLDGKLHASWSAAPAGPKPIAAEPLPGGHILIAAGHGGAVELDADGHVVWKAPTPEPTREVLSAVRLPDGSTLVVLNGPGPYLYRLVEGAAPAPLALDVENGARNVARARPYTPDGSEVLVWDNNWSNAYRVTFARDRLRVLGSLPLLRMTDVAPDGNGGVVFVGIEPLLAGVLRPPAPAVTFTFPYQPASAASLPGSDDLLIAYTGIADASWPESRPPAPQQRRVTWPRFWIWVAAGAAAGVLLLRNARGATGAGDAAPVPLELPLPPSPQQTGWLLLSGAGLVLASVGLHLLKTGHTRWQLLLVGGAVLAAAFLRVARRRRGEVDSFRVELTTYRARFGSWRQLVVGLVLVAIGSGAVMVLAKPDPTSFYSDAVGLWAGLLLLVLMLCFLDLPRGFLRDWAALGREHALLLLPLGVGLITTCWRLRDLPAYLHFDYVFSALAGLGLLEGRYPSIWHNGFVPSPVVGLVPEMLGFVLAGPGEIGIRLGSALFGLLGIVGAYVLGTLYRGKRGGLLAALLLAGNIPFFHFSRTGTNATTAVVALWTITFFALAVRRGHPRWFLLTGFAAGYTLYMWPAARVGPFAVVAAGLIWGLRYPRVAVRRAHGVPLMAVAFFVWLAPLLPLWKSNPRLAFPRTEESMEVFRPGSGVNWNRLVSSVGEPFVRSLGWYFSTPDRSTQGTVCPGGNALEATLFAAGLALALIEGFGLNVLLLTHLLTVLFFLGAFGGSPPWYTRLVPTSPIAALLAAAVLVDLLGCLGRWKARRIAFAAATLAAIGSAAWNLRTYVRYETGQGPPYPNQPMTFVGRGMRDLGPSYRFYLVVTKDPYLTVDWNRRNARLGELLPFIWNLHVTEVHELEARLPLPAGERAAFVLQASRLEEDLAVLKRFYPDAKLETLTDFAGNVVGGVVRIEAR